VRERPEAVAGTAETPVRAFAAALLRRVVGFVRELGVAVWSVLGGVVLVIVVIALLGGFAPAQRAAAELEPLGPGDEYANDQLTVSLSEAAVADDPRVVLDEADVLVTVRMRIRSHDARPLSLTDVFGKTLTLEGADPDELPRMRRVDDGSSMFELQHELAVDVDVSWELPRGTIAPGDAVRVIVSDPFLRQMRVLGDSSYWTGHTPHAVFVLTAHEAAA